MKKYIVLSVNDNVDYLYFTPLVCWAWRYFGWEPLVFYHGDTKKLEWLDIPGDDVQIFPLESIEGYRADTITQISRLYGGCLFDKVQGIDYLMTGDIDMLPLSNYWNPVCQNNTNRTTGEHVPTTLWEPKPTVWGHDLTGFGHFPICYIGMNAANWASVMNVNNGDYNAHIKRDLDSLPQAKDTDFYKYWFTDQDLITDRLKQYGTGKIDFINRGQGAHGYARGRVDRATNGWVLDQPELIDAHLEQQTHHSDEKIKRLFNLLHTVWPKEDWKWFIEYTKEFRKLAV